MLETGFIIPSLISSHIKYGLDIKRRAYSIGAFYNTDNNSAGINFKIYNFDYGGLSPRF